VQAEGVAQGGARIIPREVGGRLSQDRSRLRLVRRAATAAAGVFAVEGERGRVETPAKREIGPRRLVGRIRPGPLADPPAGIEALRLDIEAGADQQPLQGDLG
jgi:hypothetical protein